MNLFIQALLARLFIFTLSNGLLALGVKMSCHILSVWIEGFETLLVLAGFPLGWFFIIGHSLSEKQAPRPTCSRQGVRELFPWSLTCLAPFVLFSYLAICTRILEHLEIL